MNKISYLFFITIVTVFLSCKSKKGLIKNAEALDIEASFKADSLIKLINDSSFNFTWLSAKIKTKYETSKGESQSFKTYLRIQKDSAIWATITFLNIPVLVAIMTPNSVKFINKKDKKYFIGDFSFVSNMLKTPVDFYHIQNLLIGNPVSLDTTYPHYLVEIQDDVYLSSIKQSEQKAIAEENKVYFGWIYQYWINELYKPQKTILSNPSKGNSLSITQNDYNKINNTPFPNKTEALFVSQKDTITIKLNYNKVKINKPLTMKFSIPSKYTPYKGSETVK